MNVTVAPDSCDREGAFRRGPSKDSLDTLRGALDRAKKPAILPASLNIVDGDPITNGRVPGDG